MNSWFVLRIFSQHLKLIGPLTVDEIKQDLVCGKIALTDYIYEWNDRGTWIRIIDGQEFMGSLPKGPTESEFKEIEKKIHASSKFQPLKLVADTITEKVLNMQSGVPAPPAGRDRSKEIAVQYQRGWFLQDDNKEFGPFALNELEKVLDSGKVLGEILVWQKLLKNWIKIASFSELINSFGEILEKNSDDLLIEKGSNRRNYSRKIIVASVSVQFEGKRYIGVCADISEGGLQTVRLDANLEVKSQHNLLVKPLAIHGLAKFAIRSQVVWKNVKNSRIGFQFTTPMKPELLAMYLGRK